VVVETYGVLEVVKFVVIDTVTFVVGGVTDDEVIMLLVNRRLERRGRV
jgi:hypothetical protein